MLQKKNFLPSYVSILCELLYCGKNELWLMKEPPLEFLFLHSNSLCPPIAFTHLPLLHPQAAHWSWCCGTGIEDHHHSQSGFSMALSAAATHPHATHQHPLLCPTQACHRWEEHWTGKATHGIFFLCSLLLCSFVAFEHMCATPWQHMCSTPWQHMCATPWHT